MTLAIEVVYSPAPRRIEVVALVLPEGSTLADALAASGLAARHALDGCVTARWGRLAAADTLLCDGDRVELVRPLTVDPNEARRLRHAEQRAGQRAASAPRKKRRAP